MRERERGRRERREGEREWEGIEEEGEREERGRRDRGKKQPETMCLLVHIYLIVQKFMFTSCGMHMAGDKKKMQTYTLLECVKY